MSKQTLHAAFRRIPIPQLVLFLVVVAFVLRVWGIGFGLPFLFHNDEGFEVIRALQLGSGEFNFDRIGKGGLFYVLFIEYGILFIVLKVLGIVGTPNDFAQFFVDDPSLFYLAGRATTAILGTANVFVVYLIGKAAYSERAGLLAASLMAVNILHAELSHFVTVDAPMTFLASVSLLYAVRLADSGNARDYWLAALFAALASATKVPAVLLLFSLLLAHGLYIRRSGGGISGFFGYGPLWQAAIVYPLVYLLLTPGMVVNFQDFVRSSLVRFESADPVPATNQASGVDAGYEAPNLFLFYGEKLIDGMSLPIFAICLLGVIYAVVRRKNADLILLSFAVLSYMLISAVIATHLFFPRYILPLMPILTLAGGRLLDDLSWRPAIEKHSATGLALFVLLCLFPAWQVVVNNYRMTQPDTRDIGRAWILENVEAGSTILIEGHQARTKPDTIPLRTSDENIRESIAIFEESGEPGKARYYMMVLRSPVQESFDLVLVRGHELLTVEEYKQAGVEYFVLRPDARAEIRRQGSWPDFIAAVRSDPDINLVQSFRPDPVRTPGPYIEIYQVGESSISDVDQASPDT